ncbi:Glucosyltransferase-like protein, partial [Cladochytrium tenue]
DPRDALQVLARVFPVQRGLYEDKVANVWCALNVVVKLRQLFPVERLAILSAIVTLAATLPACVFAFLQPSRRRLLYALTCGSLAFFLFSFQVHEKSVLLPLLPASLLVLEEPVALMLFVNTGMFSMLPLLGREKLFLPSVALTLLYNLFLGPLGPVDVRKVPRWQAIFVWTSYATMAALTAAERLVPAPERYPDAHVVANVMCSCGLLVCLFAWYYVRLFGLVAESGAGAKKKVA